MGATLLRVGHLGRRRIAEHTTKVKLATNQHRTGINIALPLGGAIAGKVTASAGGTLGTMVTVYDTHNASVALGFGNESDGTYSVTGLLAGSYKVCFSGADAFGGKSTTGYLGECYSNVPWNG